MNSILIVDDEKDNLEALNRLLRAQFNVTMTTSPFEALKLVQKNEYSVIVSDQRMPEMNGVDLLEKTKRFSPDTIRILLTGYTDIESVVEAINRGNIYRYVAKPWNPDELKVTLRQADEAFMLHKALESQNDALEMANEELKLALEELNRLDQAKARFLSLISHELNTPLTVLISFADLLAEKREALPSEAAKASVAISKVAKRFSEIISEVLTYVRLESGGNLRLQETDFKLLVEQAAGMLSAETEKKKLVLNISSPAELTVRCDIEKMKLAVSRLIHHAIENAPAQSEVKVSLTTEKNAVKCSVWRAGDTMDEGAFEPFVASNEPLHHHQNLGLGLAICKLILEAHGGEIGLESSQQSGTRIDLSLPGPKSAPHSH
jgi:two-component system sensor histidine kinase/response regulator